MDEWVKKVLKGKITAQDPQDQVFGTKRIYLPQRTEGRELEMKTGVEDAREEEGNKGEAGEVIVQGEGERPACE